MPDVPAALSDWQGLGLAIAPDGQLGEVVDRATGRVLVRHLTIVLPAPWTPEPATTLSTELEQRWAHPGGATAVLRHVFDEAWTMRLTLLNPTADALEVPAPRLSFGSTWPTRRWFAGGEASLSVDPGRAEQLVLTQLQGRAAHHDGEFLLAPDPLVLPGDSDRGPGQFLVSWRGAWLQHLRQAASVLPQWWPERVALPDNGEVVLSLPDAGIALGEGVTAVEEGEDTWLSGTPGRHVVHVHHRLGTTDVELWWGRDPETALATEATAILQATDPRTCEPWEAVVVSRARDLVGADEVDDYLTTAAEERCARSGPVHPLDVLLVAEQAARTRDADLWRGLDDLVTDLPTEPGSVLALVHARLLAMQEGEVVPGLRASRPPARAGLSALEQAMCRVEAALLAPADEPDEDAWRVAALLGAGLPGETVGPVRLAQLVALTGLYPEHWDFTTRWPVPLALARDAATQKVLAQVGPGLEPEVGWQALAWLHLG